MIIIPGSGYESYPYKPKQEGDRVAKHLCDLGIPTFVLRYRIFPDQFPLPILDGRRAVRYVRYHSKEFGIDKNKIATMGYSSGGHLTASIFTYLDKIDFENIDDIDNESFTPNYQVLCYPVISFEKDNDYTHQGSPINMLGDMYDKYKDALTLENSKVESVAPTFIWHNFDDSGVSVINSIKYTENLKKKTHLWKCTFSPMVTTE